MSHSVISLGLGLGGGKSATSSGRLPSGSAYLNEFSLNLDGTDSYINCGDDSSLNVANLTISAWFKKIPAGAGTNTDYNYILTKYGAHYGSIHLRYRGSGAGANENKFNYFLAFTSGGTHAQGDFDTAFTLTDWHHVALTYDGSYIKGYVDGNEDLSVGEIRSLLYTDAGDGQALHIGKGKYPSPTEGLIDEVSWHGSALSATNIAAMYNSGNGPVDIGPNGLNLNPVGWWRMGDDATWDGTNWTIPDASGGVNTGTTANIGETDRKTDIPE